MSAPRDDDAAPVTSAQARRPTAARSAARVSALGASAGAWRPGRSEPLGGPCAGQPTPRLAPARRWPGWRTCRPACTAERGSLYRSRDLPKKWVGEDKEGSLMVWPAEKRGWSRHTAYVGPRRTLEVGRAGARPRDGVGRRRSRASPAAGERPATAAGQRPRNRGGAARVAGRRQATQAHAYRSGAATKAQCCRRARPESTMQQI